jgi:hypothetical protein
MPVPLIVPVGLVVAGALALSGGGKKSSGSTPTGGGGTGPAPGPTPSACEAGIAQLPPELRGPVLAAWNASNAGGMTPAQLTTSAAQLRSLADVLEGAATTAPASQAPTLRTVGACLRAKAKEVDAQAIAKGTGAGGTPGGGGAPSPAPAPAPAPTPGSSPSPYPSTVLVAEQPSPPKSGKALGPPLVDHNGVPSSWDGGARYEAVASNPYFTWKYVVNAGDSPSQIVARLFGADSIARRTELIQANPREFYTGRVLGSVGTPGTNGYNFASLLANDVLVFPRSWNPWLDQDGNKRKQAVPWPRPDGTYVATPAPTNPFGGV